MRDRPVLRFVLLAAVVVVGLLGLRWTGAINPWIEADQTSSADGRPYDGPVELGPWTVTAVVLHNRGLLAVRIESIEPADPGTNHLTTYVRVGDGELGVGPFPLGPAGLTPDLEPLGDLVLAPGARREVVAMFRHPCPLDPVGRLRVHLRTATGLRRSQVVGRAEQLPAAVTDPDGAIEVGDPIAGCSDRANRGQS